MTPARRLSAESADRREPKRKAKPSGLAQYPPTARTTGPGTATLGTRSGAERQPLTDYPQMGDARMAPAHNFNFTISLCV
jgi:hypothetical protein